ncbi:MAG: hypothetical protein JEZ06_14205 [Anaerolineaceae bacterium]|nr:hypothetical protein [Anaerolineaceae bacterium]
MKNRFNFNSIKAPILLFIIAFLSFGLYTKWFGYYGDDWSYIWYQKIMGFGGAGVFGAYDRPFSAWYYNLIVPLLGFKPWVYHIYLSFLIWLSAVLLWVILKIVWPDKDREILWIALLFTIYPGFRQVPISVEFILHYFVLVLFFFSLWCMLKSLKAGSRFWLFTAMGMVGTAGIFCLEYFIGLEILRPVFLWIVLTRELSDNKEIIKKAVLVWLPYLGVIAAFLFWRVFIFKFPTYGPQLIEEFGTNPKATSLELIKTVFSSLKTVFYNAWRQVFSIPGESRMFFLLLVIFCFVILMVYFFYLEKKKEADKGAWWQEWGIQILAVGLITTLAAGVPFWFTRIPIRIGFPWDRPMISFMVGVSMVIVGLVEVFFQNRWKVLLIAALISLTVGSHFQNAMIYRDEWNNLREMYWQLSWRIPGLKEGTVLIADDIPLYRVGDSAMTAPLNWTFYPEHDSNQLPIKLFDLTIRLDTVYTGIPGLEKDLPIMHDYRGTEFSSTTSSLLHFNYDLGTCVQILSPDDHALPELPEKVYRTMHLSNLDQIDLDPEKLASPPDFMGPEPVHGWCYYYQKADLAKQREDWNEIVRLWQSSWEVGLSANNSSEYLPFMEGFARNEAIDEAIILSEKISETEKYQFQLCQDWERMKKDSLFKDDDLLKIEEFLSSINCQG